VLFETIRYVNYDLLEVIHLRISKLIIIVITVLLFSSSSTLAWPNWQTLKTEHFTVSGGN